MEELKASLEKIIWSSEQLKDDRWDDLTKIAIWLQLNAAITAHTDACMDMQASLEASRPKLDKSKHQHSAPTAQAPQPIKFGGGPSPSFPGLGGLTTIDGFGGSQRPTG